MSRDRLSIYVLAGGVAVFVAGFFALAAVLLDLSAYRDETRGKSEGFHALEALEADAVRLDAVGLLWESVKNRTLPDPVQLAKETGAELQVTPGRARKSEGPSGFVLREYDFVIPSSSLNGLLDYVAAMERLQPPWRIKKLAMYGTGAPGEVRAELTLWGFESAGN